MTEDVEPVRQIFNRVAAEHPAPALFFGYETELWPDGAVEELVKRDLLVETTRATSAECTGCEMKCSKSVDVRPLPDKSLHAFIWCDEEPAYGRIAVRPGRLRRFQVSLRTVTKFAADCFGFPRDALVHQVDRIELANVRGRNGPRQVTVILDAKQILLRVGDEAEKLAGLIAWRGTELRIDQAELRRLVDRKLKPPSRAPRDADESRSSGDDLMIKRVERDAEIVRLGRKLKTRDRTWKKVSEEIARMPFISSPEDRSRSISADRVRRILADRDKK